MMLFNSRKDQSPCYKCTERHTACHDSCERFKEFKKYWDDISKKKNNETTMRQIAVERSVRLSEYARKRRRN